MRLNPGGIFKLVCFVGLAAATVYLWKVAKVGMFPTAIYSGLALLGVTLFLALFNARKKIPFLPLLSAATWLRIHIYLGFFSVVIFLLHIDFRVPSGMLEIVLALVFVGVTVSGVGGLILSRVLPRMMNHAGDPVIFERIPRYRRMVQENVRKLILVAEEKCNSSTLPEFYLEHLDGFINTRPSLFHPFGTERKRASYRLTNELRSRNRYLSEAEKGIVDELNEWIATKENLDFQESAQRLLRLWLFIHIPLTWSLILLGVAHGAFALLYGGNI